MKKLIFLSAITLSISQTVAPFAQGGAERLLQEIPACDEFRSVKSVNEVDKLANTAMNNAKAAIHDIKNLDQTCASIAAGSTYNSDTEIQKLITDSRKAANNSVNAVRSLDAASKKAEPIMGSLVAIGAREKCVKEAKELSPKLLAKKSEIEVEMKKVETCVNRASAAPQKAADNGFKPDCRFIDNPKPGVNCKEIESSCSPEELADGSCSDRDSYSNQ